MLLASQWGGLSKFTENFNHQDLNGNNDSHNDKEHPVSNKVIKNVILVSANLSAVELVEDVHPDEGVEDHGINNIFVGWYSFFVKSIIRVIIIKVPGVINKEVQ